MAKASYGLGRNLYVIFNTDIQIYGRQIIHFDYMYSNNCHYFNIHIELLIYIYILPWQKYFSFGLNFSGLYW